MSPIGTSFISLDREVMLTNPAVSRILGRSEADIRQVGINALTHPDDREVHLIVHRQLLAGEIDHYDLQKRYLHADGRVIWAHVSVAAVLDDAGKPVSLVSQIHDITEQVEANSRVQWLSNHDGLTGMLNRRGVYDVLEHACDAGPEKLPFGILLVDIDGFKQVNELHGHRAADRLLTSVARRLTAAMRPDSHIARTGGDEFLVQLAGPLTPGEIDNAAHLILSVLSEPVVLQDVLLTPSISIGGIECAGGTPGDLLQRVDVVLKRAKRVGRPQIEGSDNDSG